MINIFGISKKDVVSIVGSGGKTSLMFLLASQLSGKRLITTSTKIYKPENYIFLRNKQMNLKDDIYVSAEKEMDHGKIGGINPSVDFNDFDYVFIEADGSQGKPLKGWNDKEPVVVKQTNVTCGVVDISVVGETASKLNVFRIDEYKKITDYGEIISIENLKDVILNEKGLFKNALGKRILYINKVESQKDEEAVKKLTKLLLGDSRFNIDKIIAGSVKNKKFEILYTKTLIAVLASGQSLRMGKDKLSMVINEKMLIEHILAKIPCRESRIVICNDYRFEKIGEKYGFKTIINEKYKKGQSESIKCAVNHLEASNYMFVLGDQPFVKRETLSRLLNMIDERAENIIACKHGDIIGAPAIINRKYKDELLDLFGDEGAKKVIMNHLEDTFLYELDKKEFVDIDTVEDIGKWSD